MPHKFLQGRIRLKCTLNKLDVATGLEKKPDHRNGNFQLLTQVLFLHLNISNLLFRFSLDSSDANKIGIILTKLFSRKNFQIFCYFLIFLYHCNFFPSLFYYLFFHSPLSIPYHPSLSPPSLCTSLSPLLF